MNRSRLLLVAVALAVSGQLSFAQPAGNSNGFAAYYTGANAVRTTDNRAFDVPALTTDGALRFQFGFSTDEVVGNGGFFDSWTATLQTADGKSTAVYFTADAGGVQWAPPTPGAQLLDATSIARQPVAFPSLQPVYSHQLAYAVTVPIPKQFSGQVVNLYLDLFDNGDNVRSLGWVDTVTLVPEPQTLALGLLGCLALISRKCFR